MPGLCDSTPISLTSVLTYTLAFFNDVLQLISANATATSCVDSIWHGMYDMGTQPSAVLYTLAGQLGVAEVHSAVDEESKGSGAICGLSSAYEGIVLDGWPVRLLA